MPLSIDRHQQAGCAVLVVQGDLDVETAPALSTAAFAAIQSGPGPVIIDASEVASCSEATTRLTVRA